LGTIDRETRTWRELKKQGVDEDGDAADAMLRKKELELRGREFDEYVHARFLARPTGSEWRHSTGTARRAYALFYASPRDCSAHFAAFCMRSRT
jgi:hypothetical protein